MKAVSSLIFAAALVVLVFGSAAAALIPGSHRIDAPPEAEGRLPSNSVIDIVPHGGSIWFGTGHGIGQLHLSSGGWADIRQEDGLGRGGVSALAITDSVIWAATAYSEMTDYGYKPAGGGIGFSRDEGVSWSWMEQPVDSIFPRTLENVAYDIALSASAVWTASYGGGLRRLTYDRISREDYTWEVVTPDTAAFNPWTNYNHRVFSVVYDGNSLWVGTAQGINRSDDEGLTWRSSIHRSGVPGTISGNFITALAVQELEVKRLIWAATWKAEGGTEYHGVSVTEDGGLSWRVALSDSAYSVDGGQSWQEAAPGSSPPEGSLRLYEEYGILRVHNFGVTDSLVWAAADMALWFSGDLGQTWSVRADDENYIRDPTIGERFYDADYYCAAGVGDSLWVGTDDGVAVGFPTDEYPFYTWCIHRAHQPAGIRGQPDTYAYPNPFSPLRGEVVRFQIPVSGQIGVWFDIWNFAMEKVFESSQEVLAGSGVGDMAGYGAVVWDGRDARRRIAANGVYFYRIRAGGSTWWER